MNIEQLVQLTQQYKEFSPERIALSQSIGASPEERKAIATQVKLLKGLERKLPSWAKTGVYIHTHLNLEQSSSETTALYKQRFVQPNDTLLDLTGGIGVDFWAMSQVAYRSIYTEQDIQLYKASLHNLKKLLPQQDFICIEGNSMLMLEQLIAEYRPSLIYVDPARREDQQAHKRVYAIEDCSPSLHELIQHLQTKPKPTQPIRILAKLSPMLDVKHTLRSIPQTDKVYSIAHRGEVKELLLEINPFSKLTDSKCEDYINNVPLIACNIDSQGIAHTFESCFTKEISPCPIATDLGKYLYEPNGAILKLGLYNSIGTHTNTLKLHPHSQFYTSDEIIADFPGRKFEITEVIPYQSKLIKQLHKRISKAQITCRNFPLSADDLRKKLKLTDSSEATIVATTLYDGSHILLLCKAID